MTTEVATLEEFIENVKTKIKLDEATIKQDYGRHYDTEKAIHPSLSEAEQKTRALKMLINQYKKILDSGANTYHGFILAISAASDTNVARIINLQKTIDEIGQDKAKDQGLVNDKGQLMDMDKTWKGGSPNFGYGKPLVHKLLRNATAIVKKPADTEFKYALLSINEDDLHGVKCFVPYKFPARPASKANDGNIVLNINSTADFVIDPTLKSDSDTIEDLIKKYVPTKYMLKPENVEDWVIKNVEGKQKDYKNFVYIRGDVYKLKLERTVQGSQIIELSIEGTMFGDGMKSLTCFIAPHIKLEDMNFGEDSTIIVSGQAYRAPVREGGEDRGIIKVNAAGVYPIPRYIVPPKVKIGKNEVKVNMPKEEEKEEPQVEEQTFEEGW